MDNNINAANTATDAKRAADDQEHAINKLTEIAQRVQASIKSLGLHGKGVHGAKTRCNAIIVGSDSAKRLKAASELAASLRKGNAEAHKFADEIDDVLQLRLPGMEEVPPEASVSAESTGTAEQNRQATMQESSDGLGKEDGPAADSGSPMPAISLPQQPATDEVGPIQTIVPTPAPAAVPMQLADLRTAEPFCTLFPINKKTQDAIVADIQVNGFDPAQPIVVWHGYNVVVDGHTRLEAAKQAGLVDIPIVFRDFADEEAALDYAIHAQRDRRNLTDAEILRLVGLLDSRRKRGGDRRSDQARSTAPNGAVENAKRSSEETAQKIGVSPRKVERARQIIDKAAPQTLEAVKSGELTINKAAGAISESGQTGGNPGITLAAKRAVKQLHATAKQLDAHSVFSDVCAKLRELTTQVEEAAQQDFGSKVLC